MQEAPKELINELKALSNQNIILQQRNDVLLLEVESLRKLLHDCTCVPIRDNYTHPIEKL
jgi:hypothetical protein